MDDWEELESWHEEI